MKDRGGFTYTELLCVLLIIAVVWGLVLLPMVRARNRADEVNCTGRLRNISLALGVYSQDYCGQLPADTQGLAGLTPRYLHDFDVLRCPSVLAAEARWAPAVTPKPEGSADYAYRPGLAIDDLPQEAVAWDDTPRHRGGVNVLYLSGRAQWAPNAEAAR